MNAEKILRAIVLGGVFALPFVVLVVAHPLFFPFVAGKSFLFRGIVEVLFVAWAVLAFLYPKYRPRVTYVLLSIVAFVGIIGIANLFGENPAKSMWSNFERMEGYVTLLHLLAYIVATTGVMTASSQWLWFWRVSLGVSSFVTLDALAQFLLTDKFRLDATLGNPIYLAVYVLFHIFIALVLMVRHGAVRIEQVLYAATLPLHAWVLYLTATRGATLGVIGGLMVAAGGVMVTTSQESHRKKVAFGLLTALIVLVLGFWLAKDNALIQEHRVLKRFANISLTEGTILARTLVWGAALEGFKERPILGYGQENFNVVFNQHYDPRLYNREPWYDRTHNAVFDWLIAGGILGLLAYLSIFLALLWTLYTTTQFTRVQKWLLAGLLAAYGFHNLTVFDQVVSYILFFSLAAWISVNAKDVWGRVPAQDNAEAMIAKKLPAFLIVSVTVIVAAVVVWGMNSTALRANHELLQALSNTDRALIAARKNNIDTARARAEESLKHFIEAENMQSYGTQEVREHLAQAASRFAKAQWMDETEKEEWYSEAARGLSTHIEKVSNDTRVYTFLAALHSAFGEHELAHDALQEAIVLSPRKQTTLMQLSSNAGSRDNPKEAVEYARRAFELEPSFAGARSLYVTRLLLVDDVDTARDILFASESYIADPRVLSALVRAELHDDAVRAWQQALAASAHDSRIVFMLADIYKREGDIERTKKVVALIESAFPEIRIDIDAFLEAK